MKITFTTALVVMFVAGVLYGQSDAEAPDPVPSPLPTSPETWNVWGEATFDDVAVRVKPVDCVDEKTETLCLQVLADNRAGEHREIELDVRLMARSGSPMSRMVPPPREVAASTVQLDLEGGTNAAKRVVIELPEEPLRGQLSLALSSHDSDASSQEVASWVDLQGLAGGRNAGVF